LIGNAYREADGSINYPRFCDTIQNIDANSSHERIAHGHLKDNHKIVAWTLNRVSGNEDAQFAKLLAKTAYQNVTRCAHVHEAYMDLDHHNTDTITVSHFMRAMLFCDLSTKALQILVKRYADSLPLGIHCSRPHNDLNEYIRTQDLQNKPAAHPSGPPVLLPHQRDSIKIRDFRQPADEIV
jgi:hypothetical protein